MAFSVSLFCAVVLNAGSQLLFKLWAGKTAAGWTPALLLQPALLGGVLSQLLAMFFWFRVLAHAPLSTAFPMLTGGVFAAVSLLSVFLLKEKLTLNAVSGMAVILIGVAILARR